MATWLRLCACKAEFMDNGRFFPGQTVVVLRYPPLCLLGARFSSAFLCMSVRIGSGCPFTYCRSPRRAYPVSYMYDSTGLWGSAPGVYPLKITRSKKHDSEPENLLTSTERKFFINHRLLECSRLYHESNLTLPIM